MIRTKRGERKPAEKKIARVSTCYSHLMSVDLPSQPPASLAPPPPSQPPPSQPSPLQPPSSRAIRRRVLGTIGFILGLTWLAHSVCQSEASQQVDVVLSFGERAAPWREVRVDILRDAEMMAWASQTFPEGNTKRELAIKTSLPPGDYTFEIVATTRDGQVLHEVRRGTVGEGTKITIDLAGVAAN